MKRECLFHTHFQRNELHCWLLTCPQSVMVVVVKTRVTNFLFNACFSLISLILSCLGEREWGGGLNLVFKQKITPA